MNKETIIISTNESNQSELEKKVTKNTQENGHTLSVEKIKETKKDNMVIWQALPIGLLFLMLFFILQKSGVLNFGINGVVTPVTAFIIGLMASVSSCLAVVGGLILSLSAKIAEEDKYNKKPFYLFHVGRLLGFAILGGLLGVMGKAIGISFISVSVLGIIASVVMIVLGLNLVGLLNKKTLKLPSGIFNLFRRVEHQTFAPLLLGVGTFFLPCGFTQSMQVVSLSSGTFTGGMLTMFSFALGTLPMLVLLSFGSSSFADSKYASLFFKSSGVVVIGLGLFAFVSGLVGLGLINPLFNI